jgi:hypothetical protein
MKKFLRFQSDSGFHRATAYFDAYQVEDQILEGVMFEVTVLEDHTLCIEVTWSSLDYFNGLNKAKWLKAIRKYVEDPCNDPTFSVYPDGTGEELELIHFEESATPATPGFTKLNLDMMSLDELEQILPQIETASSDFTGDPVKGTNLIMLWAYGSLRAGALRARSMDGMEEPNWPARYTAEILERNCQNLYADFSAEMRWD